MMKALTAGLLLIAAGGTLADEPPVKPQAVPPAAADTRPPGQKLYARHCLPCHQADGYGVPNMQPAITDGTWVKSDPRSLAMFALTGGFNSGERKDSQNGNVMPPFAQLADEELAQILTYIREKFGKGASAVSATEVADARSKLQKPPN